MRIERWNTIPEQFRSNEQNNTIKTEENCNCCEKEKNQTTIYENNCHNNNSKLIFLLILLLIQN